MQLIIPKTQRIFREILKKVSRDFPVLSEARLVYCVNVQQDYERSPRNYAHVFCPDKDIHDICVAQQIELLSPAKIKGILWHEFGHIIAGYHKDEAEANRAIARYFGVTIKYDKELNLEYVA